MKVGLVVQRHSPNPAYFVYVAENVLLRINNKELINKLKRFKKLRVTIEGVEDE